MKLVWRLCTFKDPKRAFDGEGARLYGGRWNQRGTSVIYTSESLSLAALEILVHVEPALLKRQLFSFRVQVADEDLEVLSLASLPRNWKDHPPGNVTKALGSAWASSQKSLVLVVPSAVVPGEDNYIINPAHPDFGKLVIDASQPFSLDPRLVIKPK